MKTLLAGLCLALALGTASRLPAEDPDPRELWERGLVLARQARFGEARTAFEAAIRGFESRGDREGRYDALLSLGSLFRDAGDLEAAATTIDRALDALPGTDTDRYLALGLQQRAQVRSRRDDPDGARADLEEAGAIFLRLGMETARAETDAVASIIASWQGDFADAVALAGRAVPILRHEGSTGRYVVGALAARAYGQQELGLLEEAIESYGELIPLAWARNDQRNLNFAFCNRADLRWKLGQVEGSEEDFARAIAGFEAARMRLWGGPDERREYLVRQIRAYDRLILFLAHDRRGVEAFDVAERFHARSFLELLDEGDLDRAALDPELRRRESRLIAELGAARLAGDGPADREELDRIESELRSVRAEIRGSDPRYAELVAPAPLTADELSASLGPDEALVAYWVSDELVLAWVLTADETRLVWIPVSRSELETAVAAYLEPLRSSDRARDLYLKASEREHLELGRRIHRWLIGSLPVAVRDTSTLILVRDGFLHHLPFEALPSGCGDEASADDALHAVYRDCRYLGLDKALVYAPSGSVFASLRRRARARERALTALAMAPFDGPSRPDEAAASRAGPGPLPFSAQEVQRVVASLDGSEALVGRRATERRLKEGAGRHGVLHLATHGLIDDDRPSSSGLLLAPGEGEDGLLQAHEVLGFELASDLVTLSACRSGRGELSRAEGWIGLTRSFLYAGASRVIASLWDVDDRSTPEMMAAFYRELRAGAGAAEALRRARIALAATSGEEGLVFRRRPVAYAHPRYWAGFNLQGLP